jgi:Carboxypeptidase regulatory-like domain
MVASEAMNQRGGSSCPNPSLQRTSSGRLAAAELGSFGGSGIAVAMCMAVVTTLMISGCASSTATRSVSLFLTEVTSGAPLTSVEVVLANRKSGQVYPGMTDADGRVRWTNLPAGNYSLSTPSFLPSDHLFPSHVVVRTGREAFSVRVNLATDFPITVSADPAEHHVPADRH